MKKIKTVKIGNTMIGPDYPCYIISEIGSNFDGSLQKAKKLIKLAKDCGANAVKFQSFKTDLLLSKKGFDKKSAFQSKCKKSVWVSVGFSEKIRKSILGIDPFFWRENIDPFLWHAKV